MALPAGCVLDPATGIVSCAALGVAGTYEVRLRCTDSIGAKVEVTKNLVVQPYTPMYFSNSIGRVQYGSPYSANVGKVGGLAPFTYTKTAGVFPTGVVLNAATGQLTSAAPSVLGAFNATVRCTDSLGKTADVALSFVVANYPVISGVAGGGTAGQLYVAVYGVSGGTTPYTPQLQSGQYPPGTALQAGGFGPGDWQLQGICYTPGPYTFIIRFYDALGNYTDTATQTVIIAGP